MRVVYTDGARIELRDAAAWYERERQGLGDEFLRAIDDALLKIIEAPFRWPLIERRVRRYRMDRFSYRIIYFPDDQELRVLAIMHLSRRPGYWRDRLK